MYYQTFFLWLLLLTCNKIGVVKLADSISLVPRDAVPEVAVEHRETFFRKNPCVTDIHLKTDKLIDVCTFCPTVNYFAFINFATLYSVGMLYRFLAWYLVSKARVLKICRQTIAALWIPKELVFYILSNDTPLLY